MMLVQHERPADVITPADLTDVTLTALRREYMHCTAAVALSSGGESGRRIDLCMVWLMYMLMTSIAAVVWFMAVPSG